MSGYDSIAIAGRDTATPLNIEKRLRIVTSVLAGPRPRVVDCGCGSGDYVLALIERHGVDAIGLEYSADKVRQAHAQDVLRSRVLEGNLEAMPLLAGDFDAALLNEVLEHVPNEAAVLSEIRRVLRPGGRLIVFSPNRWFPFETHGVFVRSSGRRVPPYVPMIPYIPVALGRRFFRYWARNYGHRRLRGLIAGAGFQIESTRFVWQTFENISGTQPAWMRRARLPLRWLADTLERTPGLRAFGVSQVIVARKT
ncbi:MAG TPA: class I SAM-dependent methyltransferase [Vicinamibacterales bacterium]|nr:class I SAM-dependent methyltransferase [Vicinamibacterales bacterium]